MVANSLYRFIPYAIILLAYLAGMLVDIMEIDAAQYAVMSRDMLNAGDLMHLKDRGLDYLDKPPLIFWCTAIIYKVFGVSTFSYKLPSILFSLLAIWSVTRLTRLFYKKETAWLAGLILASAQGFFVMNNDVKTDMYMIGSMVFAIWQISAWLQNEKWIHLILGFIGVGFAFLAKGPLGLVAPALAIGFDFVLKRDWRNIFRWQWLIGLLIVGLLILPFCIALNEQYGAEGIRFFLWTQSFGRVTGESTWTNDAGAFFLVHTYAWAFLPWTILSLLAWGRQVRSFAQDAFFIPKTKEAISWGGFTLLFIAFSLSKYKLPHYIFVVFPFAAIFTAHYLEQLTSELKLKKWSTFFQWFHFGLFVLVTLIVLLLLVWAFPGAYWWVWTIVILGFGSILFAFFRSTSQLWKHILPGVMGFAMANLIVNSYLYPRLMEFQSSSVVGKYISQSELPKERIFAYHIGGRAMDFYAEKVMFALPICSHWKEGGYFNPGDAPIWVYTDDHGVNDFEMARLQFEIEKTFPSFRIGKLSLPFINPALREKVVGKRYLLKITDWI